MKVFFITIIGCCVCVLSFAQTKTHYNIVEYGAVEGMNSTSAIQKAVDECHLNGGGIVVAPPGNFITSTIFLKSNVNFFLSSGAVLKGSGSVDDYFHQDQKHGIFFAEKCQNITISGSGIIDANGTVFFNWGKRHDSRDYDRSYIRQGDNYLSDQTGKPDGPVSYESRPGMTVVFKSCENVNMSDITIKDTPEWAVRISESDNVWIRGIKIFNNLHIPNSDGIHCTSSRNVRISDCDLRCGDDAIIVTGFRNDMDVHAEKTPIIRKSDVQGNESGIAENITVTNCVLQSRSAGIRVGYGENPIRNCVFSNLVIYGSNRGIGIFARDDVPIEHIVFSNIVIQNKIHSGWWGHGEPIHVSSIPRFEGKAAGTISDISFNNITATSETGIVVYGYEKGKIKDLEFNGIKLTIVDGEQSKDFGGNFDLRPVADLQFAIFKHDSPGLYALNVDGLEINDFDLNWGAGLPDFFSHGIQCEHVDDLSIDHFSGRGAHSNFSALQLSDINNVSIVNSKADKDCGTFVSFEGILNAGFFMNNDLRNAEKTSMPKLSGFTERDNLSAQ